MTQPRIPIPHEKLAEFCRRWKITELALFGSVLRDDFGPGSDVDVLVTYGSDVPDGLFGFFQMRRELADLLGQPVDVLTRRSVESHHNPWLKHEILNSARTVYLAA